VKSSVYISSGKITVVGYSGKTVKGYMTSPLPEGVMIGGKITDSGYLAECLAGMRAQHRDLFTEPSLIVDGSAIMTKRIVTPKLSKKRYDRLVYDDFAESAGGAEMACGYAAQKTGNSMTLLACAADKELIESYMSVFREAGIKLDTIHLGIQSLINFVNARPALANTTFVLNVVDGMSMLSLLFDGGVNIFMSRNRLYSENREQLIQDVIGNLSGLIQFAKSEKFNDIQYSCYLGLDENDMRYMQAVNPYTNIQLGVLDIRDGVRGAEQLDPDAHFAFLNTLLDDGSIDLIRSYKSMGKMKKRERPKRGWIAALVVLVVLLAVPVALFMWQESVITQRTQEINDYVNDPEIAMRSANLDLIGMETARYANIRDSVRRYEDANAAMPAISDELLDLITETNSDRIDISSFDFNESGGTLRLSGTGITIDDGATYALELEENPLVVTTNFTGTGETGDGRFGFSLNVLLSTPITEGAGE
jgi:hypothetical protein